MTAMRSKAATRRKTSASDATPKQQKTRRILSPLEKSEIGVKRIREAIRVVQAANRDKARY